MAKNSNQMYLSIYKQMIKYANRRNLRDNDKNKKRGKDNEKTTQRQILLVNKQ